MIFAEFVKSYWPIAVIIGAAISAFVVFFQNIQTIRKLRLEISKLERERRTSESRIIRPSEEDIVKYTMHSHMNSKAIFIVIGASVTSAFVASYMTYAGRMSTLGSARQNREALELIDAVIRNYQRRCEIEPLNLEREIGKGANNLNDRERSVIADTVKIICELDKPLVDEMRDWRQSQ